MVKYTFGSVGYLPGSVVDERYILLEKYSAVSVSSELRSCVKVEVAVMGSCP